MNALRDDLAMIVRKHGLHAGVLMVHGPGRSLSEDCMNFVTFGKNEEFTGVANSYGKLFVDAIDEASKRAGFREKVEIEEYDPKASDADRAD